MDKVHVLIENEEYWVEGGDFDDLLEAVKRIHGRQYEPSERVWRLPGTPRQVAAAVRPYRLMHLDDDALSPSAPIQVNP